jgi:hypothetical protein
MVEILDWAVEVHDAVDDGRLALKARNPLLNKHFRPSDPTFASLARDL